MADITKDGYATFKAQVQIASMAGASGYIAGRSIWHDVISVHDPARRETAKARACSRLDELNAIVRVSGRPCTGAQNLLDVIEAMPDGWYRTFQVSAGDGTPPPGRPEPGGRARAHSARAG